MAPGQAPAPAPSSAPGINLSLDLAGAGLSNLTMQDGVAVREALADRLHICESSWLIALERIAMHWPTISGQMCVSSDLAHIALLP